MCWGAEKLATLAENRSVNMRRKSRPCATTLAASGRGDCGTLPVGMLNSNNGTLFYSAKSPGVHRCEEGASAILLLIPSTEEEGGAIQDYPASSVNREMIHQMNRKHTTKVDHSSAIDRSRPPVTPSVGIGKPTEPNHACRDRQSWQRRTSPPIAHSARSNPLFR